MPQFRQMEDYLKSIMPEPDEEEIQHRWFNAREAVFWRAYEAAKLSISYRPFPVGCAIWGYKPNAHPFERWNIYKGANIKVAKGPEIPKICAEMTAGMGAMQDGFSRAVGIVLIGQPREEDAEKVLYPCDTCKIAFTKMPIIRADTHLILARPNGEETFGDIVETTVGEMWEKFKTPRADPK